MELGQFLWAAAKPPPERSTDLSASASCVCTALPVPSAHERWLSYTLILIYMLKRPLKTFQPLWTRSQSQPCEDTAAQNAGKRNVCAAPP